MPVSDSYRTFIVEQLSRVRPVTHRKMFGGIGIYFDGAIFALIDNDTLFFKVDDATRPAYESRGRKPFQPFGPGTPPMLGYFELPEAILEDMEQLAEWTAAAIAVATKPKTRKPPKKAKRSGGPS